MYRVDATIRCRHTRTTGTPPPRAHLGVPFSDAYVEEGKPRLPVTLVPEIHVAAAEVDQALVRVRSADQSVLFRRQHRTRLPVGHAQHIHHGATNPLLIVGAALFPTRCTRLVPQVDLTTPTTHVQGRLQFRELLVGEAHLIPFLGRQLNIDDTGRCDAPLVPPAVRRNDPSEVFAGHGGPRGGGSHERKHCGEFGGGEEDIEVLLNLQREFDHVDLRVVGKERCV